MCAQMWPWEGRCGVVRLWKPDKLNHRAAAITHWHNHSTQLSAVCKMTSAACAPAVHSHTECLYMLVRHACVSLFIYYVCAHAYMHDFCMYVGVNLCCQWGCAEHRAWACRRAKVQTVHLPLQTSGAKPETEDDGKRGGAGSPVFPNSD